MERVIEMSSSAKMPDYMKRYVARVLLFMGAYVAVLTGSLIFANNGGDHAKATLVGLALVSALPIIGVFWAIFRLLVETDDEYQRLLFAKQTLWGTALTLAITTVWQFLEVFNVVASGPQWVGAIWFAMFGVGGAIVRWRA
jgi:uncharacterized YccA/Bax inhibitor family protein